MLRRTQRSIFWGGDGNPPLDEADELDDDQQQEPDSPGLFYRQPQSQDTGSSDAQSWFTSWFSMGCCDSRQTTQNINRPLSLHTTKGPPQKGAATGSASQPGRSLHGEDDNPLTGTLGVKPGGLSRSSDRTSRAIDLRNPAPSVA